jgi:hypothetical protein
VYTDKDGENMALKDREAEPFVIILTYWKEYHRKIAFCPFQL